MGSELSEHGKFKQIASVFSTRVTPQDNSDRSQAVTMYTVQIYDINTQESNIRDDQYKTLRLGIGSNFAITRNLSSRLSWDHTKQKRDIQGTVNIDDTNRDLVLLSFSYAWPLVH